MYYVDYHMHSKYSCDGCEEVSTICEAAISRNVKEIAITDHYDTYEDQTREDVVDLEGLYRDILAAREVYKDKLQIKFGVEIGQSHFNLTNEQKLLKTYPFDFVIGSVHNLNDTFDMGKCDYTQTKIEPLYDEYLDALITLAQKGDFDAMGHITYPVRYCYSQTKHYPSFAPFKEKIEYLYKELIKRDRGIEINCSGYFQSLQRPMPDLELVTFYKECGGKILTIGCDSHHRDTVGISLKQGMEVVKEAGFTEITTFTKRIPTFIKIA
ncbi:MAG: hypothetical protein ATN36_01840 [Epulopiscium sp. Nele67-Bin005]|nr:MAG: hypothetical protein ATN36_01840 [Epulopiscium sp. Nele67-Bin005]